MSVAAVGGVGCAALPALERTLEIPSASSSGEPASSCAEAPNSSITNSTPRHSLSVSHKWYSADHGNNKERELARLTSASRSSAAAAPPLSRPVA